MTDSKEEGGGSVAAAGAVTDVRVETLCQFCLKTLKVKSEKWTKMMSQAECVTVINEFLEKGEIQVLVIQLTPAGALLPSTKFSLMSKNKALYVIKKTPEPIKKAGCKQAMIFGDMATFPLDQLTSVVDSVSRTSGEGAGEESTRSSRGCVTLHGICTCFFLLIFTTFFSI